MKPLRYLLALIGSVSILVLSIFTTNPARAASLVEITNFGTNPTGLKMHLYVPASVTAKPAILVAIHYCTGSGPAFYSGTEFASLADRYGFIVIYPSATRSGNCYDVSSTKSLTRNGGSDPVGIMSMVTYVQQNRNGDPNRVYVTGASSGGMMTNVMLGDYPDVFKAGAAFMGVPFGCFAASAGDPTNPANQAGWNSACAGGTSIKTPQQWGDIVRAAYPGYTGARPRMMVLHGTTDTTLAYPNFGEEIKQWTNVLGISQTPSFTDQPQSGWTRTRYGSTGVGGPVEGISVQGVGHSLPLNGMAAMVIQFFGLDGTAPVSTATRTNTPNVPVATATRTNTPTVGPSATPSSGSIFINAGGSATGSFLADQYFSGGTAYTNTRTTDVSQITSNPPPAAIFTTERYGAMSYTFTNRSGAQTVTLYFSENYATAAGQRLFNVTINGTTVLNNFDIYASAGGQDKGIARTFNTTANGSGQVVIQFVTGTENPKISGIAIASGAANPTNTPTRTPTTVVGPTITPSITPTTVVGPTVTPSNTPTSDGSGTCSPVTSTVTAPFTKDGAGTFCWQISNIPNYVNSWNTTSININGVNATNLYIGAGSLPAKIGGYYYISYSSSVAWAHFEAK